MKKALDDPKLGIKVIDVREANQSGCARENAADYVEEKEMPDSHECSHGVGLPLSQINERFTELDPNTRPSLSR